MEIKINNNIDEELEKVKELIKYLDEANKKYQKLHFISTKEFAEISGWSMPVVSELYNKKDFPSCDYGREKIAEINAVRNYFSVPRRK